MPSDRAFRDYSVWLRHLKILHPFCLDE